MLNRVKTILSKYTEKEITAESALAADLGLTSFDVVSVVTEFEDEFGIEISDRDIRKLITVGDILDYIEKSHKGV